MTTSSSSSSRGHWPKTRVAHLLGLAHPIIQGPFGGGLSSVALAAAVSRAGGLGSFGAYHLDPAAITAVAGELHDAVPGPFALNLWVPKHDVPEDWMTRERFAAAVERLQPLYDELEVPAPGFPERFLPSFEEQVEAVLRAAPAAFSFVFGVPEAGILSAFKDYGIVTLGTATTPDEAVALDEAGVDVVVASGSDAGGHRGAFLADVEDSLVGTLPLVRVAAAEIAAPVVAAGGIADAHGIVAALALGAEGVQIGTAFLATEESGTTAEHRAALLSRDARHTRLTRAFSGRPARGIPTPLAEQLTTAGSIQPFPYQGYLLKPILAAARAQGRTDLVSLWAGQGAPLLEHRHAEDLFAALVAGTQSLLGAAALEGVAPTVTPARA